MPSAPLSPLYGPSPPYRAPRKVSDQVKQAEAAVTELTDRFHIIVTAPGSTIALDVPKSMVPTSAAGPTTSVTRLPPILIFAITVAIILAATLLFI